MLFSSNEASITILLTQGLRSSPGAHVVQRLVIYHKTTILVIQRTVSGENRIIRLHGRSGDIWRGINDKVQLCFLSVIFAEVFQQQSRKTTARATTARSTN